MLPLPEQLLLLALHDEKGSVLFSASTALRYGLAGAVLLDLLFQDKVALVDDKIRMLDRSQVDDATLNRALDVIEQSKKDRSPKYWIGKIPHKIRDLQDRITDQLVQKNILRREGRSFLWVFEVNRYPTANAVPESEIRHRIRNIVLHDHPADETNVALISLMKACGLVNEVFSKDERKAAKRKIKELAESEQFGKAVSAVVTEMTIAITAAITAATVSSH